MCVLQKSTEKQPTNCKGIQICTSSVYLCSYCFHTPWPAWMLLAMWGPYHRFPLVLIHHGLLGCYCQCWVHTTDYLVLIHHGLLGCYWQCWANTTDSLVFIYHGLLGCYWQWMEPTWLSHYSNMKFAIMGYTNMKIENRYNGLHKYENRKSL